MVPSEKLCFFLAPPPNALIDKYYRCLTGHGVNFSDFIRGHRGAILLSYHWFEQYGVHPRPQPRTLSYATIVELDRVDSMRLCVDACRIARINGKPVELQYKPWSSPGSHKSSTNKEKKSDKTGSSSKKAEKPTSSKNGKEAEKPRSKPKTEKNAATAGASTGSRKLYIT